MGSPTPFFATRHGDYVMGRDLDALDEARLRADDLDAEARREVNYQEWLDQMSEMAPAQQRKILDALNAGNTFSRWTIEVATTEAFERAVTEKKKEIA